MQVPWKMVQLVFVRTLAQARLCREPPAQSLNAQPPLAYTEVAKASDKADR